MNSRSSFAYPAPAGWRAVCLVPTCNFTARGHDEADAEAGLLEHLRLEHAIVEPDQADGCVEPDEENI